METNQEKTEQQLEDKDNSSEMKTIKSRIDPAEQLKYDIRNYKDSWKKELFDEEDDEDVNESETPTAEEPVPTREEQEKEARNTRNELIFGVVILELLLQLIGNLILRLNLRFTIGALFGGGIAVLLVNLMLHSVFVSTDYDKRGATGYMRRSYFLRVGIMLAVLGGSLWLLWLPGFFGCILGILTLKFSAMLWPLLHKYNIYQKLFSRK